MKVYFRKKYGNYIAFKAYEMPEKEAKDLIKKGIAIEYIVKQVKAEPSKQTTSKAKTDTVKKTSKRTPDNKKLFGSQVHVF